MHARGVLEDLPKQISLRVRIYKSRRSPRPINLNDCSHSITFSLQPSPELRASEICITKFLPVMASTEAFKELPRDIAAVDVKGKTYVFFVNSNHQLCYLVSPGAGTDDYDPKLVELTDGDLKVKCGSRQIAAAAWQGGNGQEVSLITSFYGAF